MYIYLYIYILSEKKTTSGWFWNSVNSPVEVGWYLKSCYLRRVFSTIPTGGWPWDFWTINSSDDVFEMVPFQRSFVKFKGRCSISPAVPPKSWQTSSSHHSKHATEGPRSTFSTSVTTTFGEVEGSIRLIFFGFPSSMLARLSNGGFGRCLVVEDVFLLNVSLTKILGSFFLHIASNKTNHQCRSNMVQSYISVTSFWEQFNRTTVQDWIWSSCNGKSPFIRFIWAIHGILNRGFPGKEFPTSIYFHRLVSWIGNELRFEHLPIANDVIPSLVFWKGIRLNRWTILVAKVCSRWNFRHFEDTSGPSVKPLNSSTK